MRPPMIVAATVAALALLVAACGGDDATTTSADVVDDASGTDEDTAREAGDGVPAGAAAVVDGVEISVDELDEQVEIFAQSPPIAEQLEATGEEAMGFLEAQVLSTLIAVQIITASAEELGAPVTEDDLVDARTELEAQAGGPDELEALLEEQGVTGAQLSVELRGIAAMRNVEQALEADDAGSSEATQQYLAEQLSSANVAVDAGYGTWDARSAQVIPPGIEAPPGA